MEITVSYEHSLRHSYMHLKNISIPTDTYESRLLKEACIPGTVKMNFNVSTEDNILSYIISGLEPMEKYIESNPMSHTAISSFMESLNKLLFSLEEYMVSENSIFLSPSSVFFNPEKEEWLFTVIPSYMNTFHSSLSDLLSYLLKHVDYKDDRAVIIAYSLFQETGKEFFQITDLLRIVRTNIAKEQQSGNTLSAPESSDDSSSLSKKTPVSDDGIFRPIDAGIVLDSESSFGKNASSLLSDKNTPDLNGVYPQKYSVPSTHDISPSPVFTGFQKINTCTSNEANHDIGFCSDYGKSDFPEDDLVPGVTVKNLAEEEPAKNFGIFSFHKKNNKLPSEKQIPDVQEYSIEESLNKKSKEGAFKGKLIFTGLLMIMIPALVWFLKGGLVFKKAFPLILALEIGLCMMIALDLIMNKLPDEG